MKDENRGEEGTTPEGEKRGGREENKKRDTALRVCVCMCVCASYVISVSETLLQINQLSALRIALVNHNKCHGTKAWVILSTRTQRPSGMESHASCEGKGHNILKQCVCTAWAPALF